ncbi:MAG: SPFH domain-containing protein, partial [Candidatus Eisenbacteria bacterium]
MTLPFFAFWIIGILVLLSSIKIVRESERAAIFRSGQFLAVRGPGFIWVVPILDRVEIVDLNLWIPEWQGLSKTDLDERVKS